MIKSKPPETVLTDDVIAYQWAKANVLPDDKPKFWSCLAYVKGRGAKARNPYSYLCHMLEDKKSRWEPRDGEQLLEAIETMLGKPLEDAPQASFGKSEQRNCDTCQAQGGATYYMHHLHPDKADQMGMFNGKGHYLKTSRNTGYVLPAIGTALKIPLERSWIWCPQCSVNRPNWLDMESTKIAPFVARKDLPASRGKVLTEEELKTLLSSKQTTQDGG